MAIRVQYDKAKLNGLVEGLKGTPSEIRDELYNVVGSSLMQVHRIAVPNAPYKSGTLRRSLTWTIASALGGGAVLGAVGSNLVYARIQERGGDTGRNKRTHITGKFYLSRAVAQSKDDIANRFAKIRILKKR